MLGELQYALGKCLGRESCALCDISHGWNPLGKSVWRKRKETTQEVIWLHRDEAPASLLAAVEGELPCVVADHGGRVQMLLSKETLKGCKGDFAAFTELLNQKLRALQIAQTPATRTGSGINSLQRAPPDSSS